jgi:hypothetical protein
VKLVSLFSLVAAEEGQVILAHDSNGATETRNVFGKVSYCLYFGHDTGISISLVCEKIHRLRFG